MSDNRTILPHIAAEMAALEGRPIDLSDIPEVTDFSGFRKRNGEWHQKDRRFVMDVGEDVAGWFGERALAGEDWREGAKRALQEHITQATRKAA